MTARIGCTYCWLFSFYIERAVGRGHQSWIGFSTPAHQFGPVQIYIPGHRAALWYGDAQMPKSSWSFECAVDHLSLVLLAWEYPELYVRKRSEPIISMRSAGKKKWEKPSRNIRKKKKEVLRAVVYYQGLWDVIAHKPEQSMSIDLNKARHGIIRCHQRTSLGFRARLQRIHPAGIRLETAQASGTPARSHPGAAVVFVNGKLETHDRLRPPSRWYGAHGYGAPVSPSHHKASIMDSIVSSPAETRVHPVSQNPHAWWTNCSNPYPTTTWAMHGRQAGSQPKSS